MAVFPSVPLDSRHARRGDRSRVVPSTGSNAARKSCEGFLKCILQPKWHHSSPGSRLHTYTWVSRCSMPQLAPRDASGENSSDCGVVPLWNVWGKNNRKGLLLGCRITRLMPPVAASGRAGQCGLRNRPPRAERRGRASRGVGAVRYLGTYLVLMNKDPEELNA